MFLQSQTTQTTQFSSLYTGSTCLDEALSVFSGELAGLTVERVAAEERLTQATPGYGEARLIAMIRLVHALQAELDAVRNGQAILHRVKVKHEPNTTRLRDVNTRLEGERVSIRRRTEDIGCSRRHRAGG